jgi:hypothetical protein
MVSLLFVLGTAVAQETGTSAEVAPTTETQNEEPVRVYYVPTQPLTDDADTLELASIINRALVRAVERLNLTPVVGDTIQPLAAARDVGALLVIESSATVERRELVMSFRAIEASTARVIAADFVPTLVGVSVHNRIREVVEGLAGRLEEFLANPGAVEAFDPFVLSAEVLMGPDGTVISLPSGQELAVVDDGSAQLPFDPYPVGTNIVLRREHPGYHTEESPVTFGSANATLELRSLWKETRWAVDAHSALGQVAGLGVGGRYFIDPDIWFVGAQNYFYVQPSQIPNASDIYHNDIGLWTGRYFFFPYDSAFRLGLGAGIGTILTRIGSAENPLFTDYYLMPLSFWVEYNIRKWTFFLRSELKQTLGIGQHILGTQTLGVQDADGQTASGIPIVIGVGRKL